MLNKIVKRDGSVVDFDAQKLNKWCAWADNNGVNWSDVALKAYSKCYEGCSTVELQQSLIDACVDKADTKHFKMAGRLLIGNIYKAAFGGINNIPTLYEFYTSMTQKDLWVSMDYSEDDFKYLETYITHSSDLSMTYSEVKQLKDKYMITDRTTKHCHESPQFMFMGMALANMEAQPKDRRLQDVVKLYQYLRDKKINAPTPFMSNLRTKHKGYASCCVYNTNDSAKSLAAGDHIAYMMTCASAGIGANIRTRAKGDPVRNGTIEHQGKRGYYNMVQAAVKANLQNSRGGSATIYYNVLEPEIEELLTLKSVTTPTNLRIAGVDYSVGYNSFFAEQVAKNGKWMLISSLHAPDLHEAMYSGDIASFKQLYNMYVNSQKPKTFVDARELVINILTQSIETGRIYLHMTDEMNRHTPFNEKIYLSNLCAEIAIISKGYHNVTDLYKETYTKDEYVPETGLCSLSAIVAKNTTISEYYDVAYYTLLMIDNVLTLMDYPFPNLKYTATRRRNIGVGITNLAHLMASKGLKYSSQEGKNFIHEYAELHSFSLHKASLQLAKEKGNCEWIDKTKYPQGWLPIDTYNKNVDSVVTTTLKQDWETLRAEIIANGGIRHSVLEAIMPNESSSVATNTTNSIYPVRSLKLVKTSGKTKNVFLAPDFEELAEFYEIAWDMKTTDLIDLYSIIQKFTGQSISSDFYVDFSKLPGNKMGTTQLITEFLYMTKMGMKTRYYINTKTSKVAITENTDGNELYSAEAQDADDCEACKL